MVKFLAALRKLFAAKDLRKKVLITLFLLFLVRVIAHIPLPNINHQALQDFFGQNQLLGILDIFSGGTLSRVSIAFMGVGPYITSSIIMQLLTIIVPQLEEMSKEGEWGRGRINQYSRLLTVPIAILQSFGLLTILRNAGVIGAFTPVNLVMLLIVSTGSTLLMMWLGELVSENGIGNGISLIITLGILASAPGQIQGTSTLLFAGGLVDTTRLASVAAFIVIALLTIGFVILMNQALRKIPVSYARAAAISGRSVTVDTHLPLKVSAAGVIPIIFALSIIVFPGLIAKFMLNSSHDKIVAAASAINRYFNPNSLGYGVSYFILVVAFTYFYTSIIFKPSEVAENLQKRGGFIPGFRPGGETAKYLAHVMNRITLPGALFLGIIAILPFIMQYITKVNTLVIGGTSILIVVSVVLETANHIRAQLIQKSYDVYY